MALQRCILFGRAAPQSRRQSRTVMGIRGEPRQPADPAHGVVWTAIVEQVDLPGSESAYVTVEDVPRERYAEAPLEHRRRRRESTTYLESLAERTVVYRVQEIGYTGQTRRRRVLGRPWRFPSPRCSRRADDLMSHPVKTIRDWALRPGDAGDFSRMTKRYSNLHEIPETASISLAVAHHAWQSGDIFEEDIF